MKQAIILLSLFIFFSGCSSEPQNSPNSGGLKNAAADQSVQIDKDSPTGVLKAFTDAKNAKDPEGMKRALSAGTLKTFAEVAQGNNATVDDFLKRGNTTPLNKSEMPETRNEKITGDAATVEIKRSIGDKWRTLTFVKEGGAWKMDLNKYINEIYPNLSR
jgi:hypothetical protein